MYVFVFVCYESQLSLKQSVTQWNQKMRCIDWCSSKQTFSENIDRRNVSITIFLFLSRTSSNDVGCEVCRKPDTVCCGWICLLCKIILMFAFKGEMWRIGKVREPRKQRRRKKKMKLLNANNHPLKPPNDSSFTRSCHAWKFIVVSSIILKHNISYCQPFSLPNSFAQLCGNYYFPVTSKQSPFSNSINFGFSFWACKQSIYKQTTAKAERVSTSSSRVKLLNKER